MKSLSGIATIALLAAGFAGAGVQANAQQRDYQVGTMPAAQEAAASANKHIYLIPGVTDNGSAIVGQGVATSFLCTNASAATVSITFKLRTFDGTLVATRSASVTARNTITASTHGSGLFAEDIILKSGHAINQGSMDITATNLNVFCSAIIVNSSSQSGIALHMVRYNGAPGTAE